MRSPSKILAKVVLATAVAAILGAPLGGCGGSDDSPPTALSTRFDDMYIAAIPLDQKQQVVQRQNDWSLAKMENAKAEADLNDAATQLSIARNDQKAARLGVESAVASKKAAEASAETTRINQAAKDLHTAEAVAKAADQRIRYLEVYIAYQRVVHRHAQENMYWREAQYEVAKAQVAQKGGIAPKGVSYDAFPRQEEDRSKRASSSKDRVSSARQRAQEARDSWKRAQDTADRESGRPSNFLDPMSRSASSSR